MTTVIKYLIDFILNTKDKNISSQVAYTSDSKEFAKYKVVIYPSRFFSPAVYGTPESLPDLPLKKIENTPILFGEPKIEKQGDTFVLHADIIASAYFLISRYEEYVKRDVRDVHGRFPGKESIPYKAGFINRPIIEEYGQILRKLLRETGLNIQEPQPKLQKIYLTHDVDAIAHYRRLRGVAGAILKNSSQAGIALKSYFKNIHYDPWFTFPWLLEQDSLLDSRAESIFFIKPGGGKNREDQPHSKVNSKDFKYLFHLLEQHNASIGLHASYEAGINPTLIKQERTQLEQATNQNISYNRNHYLNTREPEDMQKLYETGITDDFTLGYADVAGFRIGTCRPVNWINPSTQQLTPLCLHPLTMMDGSLSEKRYMNLPEDEAYNYAINLITETERHGGDLCLLWHNTSVEKNGNNYHRTLYSKLINYLKDR